ncbi:ABC transporter ATP-binding protein [Saccharicrinis sp. GN24d3]|uniref:ABC transporter ATP-binding protein n=1 Tax=Saccharicrinis sp. GN24d3 TaxID=3458416 RepID=UPI004036D722
MSKTVIKIENLSKIYRLGEVGTGTLSHDLNRFVRMNILGQDDPYAKVGHVNDRTQKAEKGELVAALRDINLEVKEGEVLGIIGKNGAGKSTLLKLLSRVTSPTTGSIKVKGRLASLLEVGTGFHPEMTGRENIYMNGTIMGMRKWEIDRKLDEIVEFAGVAKYLDTPTKRYSSGMTVRLGFAIAAHLEPEILVVDEVLAVGDAEFQKKAIGKMQDVSTNDGRTVLFVSHNMAAVQRLCPKSIILKQGQKVGEGQTSEIVPIYLEQNRENMAEGVLNRTPQQIEPFIEKIELFNSNNENTSALLFGEPFSVRLTISAKKEFDNIEPLIAINTLDDHRIFTAISSDQKVAYSIKGDKLSITTNFAEQLTPGQYKLIFALRSGRNKSYDLLMDAMKLNVSELVHLNTVPNEKVLGFIRPQPQWT